MAKVVVEDLHCAIAAEGLDNGLGSTEAQHGSIDHCDDPGGLGVQTRVPTSSAAQAIYRRESAIGELNRRGRPRPRSERRSKSGTSGGFRQKRAPIQPHRHPELTEKIATFFKRYPSWNAQQAAFGFAYTTLAASGSIDRLEPVSMALWYSHAQPGPLAKALEWTITPRLIYRFAEGGGTDQYLGGAAAELAWRLEPLIAKVRVGAAGSWKDLNRSGIQNS